MDSDKQKITKTEEEWKKELTPEEYRVMREKGTEAPFAGKYWDNHEEGMYRCRACGNELFSSDTKFSSRGGPTSGWDSGTGWPSFTEPMNREHILLREDTSYGTHRVEVLCKQCGAHLGHVFDDGPQEKGGKRYCINSISLDFEKK